MTDDAKFAVGDHVVCVADHLDGSWEGCEGTIKRVHFQQGGTLAPSRWIYYVEWDDEIGLRGDDDLDSSETFTLEPL